jgi:hypothetical protein
MAPRFPSSTSRPTVAGRIALLARTAMLVLAVGLVVVGNSQGQDPAKRLATFGRWSPVYRINVHAARKLPLLVDSQS